MKRLLSILLLLLSGFSIAAADTGESAPARPRGLIFGSVAMDIPAIMHRRLTPLTRYLSAHLGMPVELRLSPNMPAAIDAVASGQVDIAYLTPVAYLRAHEKGKVRLLVKTVTRGKDSFRLMIVVREDSPIRQVRDLVDHSFAFGDRAALLQRAVVVGAGVRLDELSGFRFLGHYDNIARAVLNGDFDAGILKDTMAYQWQGRGLRILYQSPDLPPYNIAVRAGLDPAIVQRLREAFLSLDPQDPAHRAVIKALDPKYDGFAPATDADYDVVRRLTAPFRQTP